MKYKISSPKEYKQTLALMDELIEDNNNQQPLIEVLALAIERWENTSPDFTSFNSEVASINAGIATLKTLMEQYHLGVADFPEIGSKSLVSKILNGKRSLTYLHINALSKRFGITPALFFDNAGTNSTNINAPHKYRH